MAGGSGIVCVGYWVERMDTGRPASLSLAAEGTEVTMAAGTGTTVSDWSAPTGTLVERGSEGRLPVSELPLCR